MSITRLTLRGASPCAFGRGAALYGGLNIFLPVARAERGRAQAGEPFLPGHANAQCATAPVLCFIAHSLHSPYKSSHVLRLLGKASGYLRLDFLLKGKGLAIAEPFTIMLEITLAARLGVFDVRKPVFKANAV